MDAGSQTTWRERRRMRSLVSFKRRSEVSIRFSTRQPLAPAHKQHGGKGVAEGLGGAGYSRDSCASLPISGVVQEASGLSAVGSEEATVQLSSVVPNPGSSDTSHLHNAAQVRPQ